MANFYLCRVWTLEKLLDGSGTGEKIIGTEASLRYVMDEWETVKHDGSKVVVKFPRLKYRDIRFSTRFADGDRNADPIIPPTIALLRVEGELETGDYNIDMTTKTATQWQTMYDTYPYLATHPYIDAPYQPIG